MKLYGETVEIRQSDITQDEMNPESKRLVVASHDRIKHLIDIIQNGSESEKEDAIVSLKEKQTTTPIQDWRNFSKEVDSVFGERFLVKLDIFIAEYGIDKAIEIIKNLEKGKPQIKELDLR